MEMLEEIKTELEKVSEITNVEILTHKYNNYNYLKVEGPYEGCPGIEHPVTKLIESIAAKYGKETDGWGRLSPSKGIGFTVSFAPAGHSDSVKAFYSGTRYFGD